MINTNIHQKFENEEGKKLFMNEIDNSLSFISESFYEITKIDDIEAKVTKQKLDQLAAKTLVDFCKINQFFNFNKNSQKELREVYSKSLKKFKSNGITYDIQAVQHNDSVAQWMIKNDLMSELLCFSKNRVIEFVPNSEYSAEIQINILDINIYNLIEPVLDIGCGKQMNLLMYLKEYYIKGFGIDRFAGNSSFCKAVDWLDYDYGFEKWGTVISNMSFTNHFKHQHFKVNSSYQEYARKFLAILDSLKVGGSFHYSPDLPFFEDYLDETKYSITKKEIGVNNYKSVKITKL
ncbi:MAG: hypothetical protein A2W91_08460 [Bacteroidetes bacterium GWF2_38_335]|nr:MAG: hypothetical protein A2W91_08460 [Bacteroidetes bacterium GWF2_38_335]OFY78927.1 MAG: hypothetical protein A2281_02260 [Bacteroidetes bacterium RIFOXYA12_FULL_38_20]HBS85990.1 hypothetical protein [Bacteroidales bacterium]